VTKTTTIRSELILHVGIVRSYADSLPHFAQQRSESVSSGGASSQGGNPCFGTASREPAAPRETRSNDTPLLDRLKSLPDPAPPPPDTQFAVGLITAVLTLVASVIIWSNPSLPKLLTVWIRATFTESLRDGWIGLRILAAPLAILLAPFAVILVHESGHVLVGLCAGFRFNSMRVSRIQIDRLSGFSVLPSGRGPAGWASMIPVKSDKLALRHIAMVLAGPIANLATGYAVLLLPGAKGFFTGGFIFWSFLAGITNLVPFRRRGTLSDGKWLLTLVRDPALGERPLALAKLNAELREGVPPDCLSADFLAKALAVRDDSLDAVAAHSIAYAAAWWQHDYATAAQMLETCLAHSSHVPPVVRHILMSDAGVFQARRRGRVDLAEEWLAMIPERTEFPGLRPRVEAAILEAQGDLAGALEKLEEVETLFRGIPDRGLREANVRFIGRWKAELVAADRAQAIG
jgi:hypothetical protein